MSYPIFLYNTLSRSKELFSPIDPSLVRVYSCGPTVYGEPHIGNFRAFMLADLLGSVLTHVGGYRLHHVMNITDVGHLTDDGDQGEDKMEKGARKEGKTVWEVARTYEEHFHQYLEAFNIRKFYKTPRATEHINEQISMIKTLGKKGYTYSISGDGIYMDTSKVVNYGKLAQLDIEGLSSQFREEGAMINSSKKKQLTDFALWKFSPKNEVRGMEWTFDGKSEGALIIRGETPVERNGFTREHKTLTEEERNTAGFPGRHVECSAMAAKYLGEQFDIHTGGVDHIPVHHTNEIVQSECCFGVDKSVNYRLHQQFLNIDGGKMSKSKGHDFSVPGVIAEGFSPLDIRYFYLTAQYSSFLDYSEETALNAQKTRRNIIKKLVGIKSVTGCSIETKATPGVLYEAMIKAIADDLNTPKALSLLHEGLTSGTESEFHDIMLFDQQILKCGFSEGVLALLAASSVSAPDNVVSLAEQRVRAKNEKNYELADQLREEITLAGRSVKDTAGGFELLQS